MTRSSDPHELDEAHQPRPSEQSGLALPTGEDPDAGEDDHDEREHPIREPAVEELVLVLDEVFAVAEDWADLPGALIDASEDAGFDLTSPVMAAARYATRVVLRHTIGRRHEVTLELLVRPLTGTDTSRPKDADPATAALWRHVAEHARHPAARARFWDLLVLHGGPGIPQVAATASRAYQELATYGPHRVNHAAGSLGEVDLDASAADHLQADAQERAQLPPGTSTPTPGPAQTAGPGSAGDHDAVGDPPNAAGGSVHQWHTRSAVLAVGRALTLSAIAASAQEGPAAQASAVALALELADEALARPGLTGGRCLMLLQLIGAVRDLPDSDKHRVADLAERLLHAQPDHLHLVDGAAQIVRGVHPARRREMDEIRVRARLLAAQSKPPAGRLLLLEQAAALAGQLSRPDLAAEATRAMQSLDKTGLGFTAVTATTSIPAEAVDIEVEQWSRGATWREALDSWLAGGSPAGDPVANQRAARRQHSASILRHFFPAVLFGADGLPRWHARGEDDEVAHDLAIFEQHHIEVHARLLADALDRIAALGRPAHDDLVLHLSDDGAGHLPLAAALARAFGYYWEKDWEACVHTSVPRVEAAARELVQRLDLPAYQVARKNEPGKYVGLGALLTILDGAGFDPAWERFLRTFLTGPLGMNVRNDVAHGFVIEEPTRESAALALRALALLVPLLTDGHGLTATPSAAVGAPTSGTIVAAVASFVLAAARRPRDLPGLLTDEVEALRALVKAGLRGRERPSRT